MNIRKKVQKSSLGGRYHLVLGLFMVVLMTLQQVSPASACTAECLSLDEEASLLQLSALETDEDSLPDSESEDPEEEAEHSSSLSEEEPDKRSGFIYPKTLTQSNLFHVETLYRAKHLSEILRPPRA